MSIWQKLCILLSLIVSILVLGIILFVCLYFKNNYNDNPNNYIKNKFEIVDKYNKNDISFIQIYDTKSEVLYLIIESANKFAITPLYNSDGSLQLYHDLK